MMKGIAIVALACGLAIVANACSITLPDDVKGFAPVLLTRTSSNKDYELFKPSGKTTELSDGTKLLLACTGSKNVIVSEKKSTLELTCSGDQFVDANNNAYDLKDLVCKSIPSPTLRVTDESCSQNRGVIHQPGFTVNKKFYGPVFEICYNNDIEHTYYTHNTINGATIDNAISESTRRSFSAKGMKYTTTKTNKYYTQANQVELFKKLFGSKQTYIDGSDYFARGHLTPDADFIFGYEQLATYFYTNVAPEYQLINAGNWLRVEELARSVAASYGDDLETYNGYLGQLQLEKSNGQLIDIFLDDGKKIEAPKYYFKVLLHKPSDEGIVFVTVNNPFAANGEAEEICENVCDQADLKHDNFPTLSKGYTFCCRLEEFKLSYDALPEDVEAGKLMTRKN
ncbi:uncharacterized protein LOC101891113 [Musca domestica]|uniref:Uncharacterized protein LOC101891113 n=2 Tax=Musca domestica TaxID=7370 RepID=A0A9J7I2C5_MUSDO|nr:uncharacterized protein LOC101891113 [Musca domestica]